MPIAFKQFTNLHYSWPANTSSESKSPSLPETRWELRFLNPFVQPRWELDKPVPSKAFYSQPQKPLSACYTVGDPTHLPPSKPFYSCRTLFLHPAQYKAQQKLTLGIIAGLYLVNGWGGKKYLDVGKIWGNEGTACDSTPWRRIWGHVPPLPSQKIFEF